MSQDFTKSAFEAALTRLRADAESLPWPDRHALAKGVAEELRQGRGETVTLQLLRLLADDSKWEVRHRIADALVFAPDDDFGHLVAKLSSDSNAVVRKAAERSLTRRRKVLREDRKRRRGADLVMHLYERLRGEHGDAAAEKAWEMAERRFDLLAGTAVHDMRRMLTRLTASSRSLLAMSHSRAADFQDVAVKIAEDVAFLERYTKAISDYARSLPVERRVERLCDVVASAEDVAKRGLQEKIADPPDITLTTDVPEDLTLEIARELIVVALSHIITNAFEAILAKEPPVQGEVTLTARLVDDEVRITVADNGTGLSVEQVQALMAFVPGPKDNAKKESTGFGLPTASRYIRAHGGSLAIDGQEEVGAVVIISLPAKQNVRDEP